MKLFLPNEVKDYYRFFQVPARRWWFGLIGLVATVMLYLGYMLLISGVITRAALLVDAVEWKNIVQFLVTNLGIGGLTGVSVLVSWILFHQGFGWLSSVVGRFRWKWFAVTVIISGMGFLLFFICDTLFFAGPEALEKLAVRPYTVFLIVAILLIKPFQAAGEEFLFRGILGRLMATSVPFRKMGLALSALIPTLLFMLLHTDEHFINNIFYISFGFMAWWLAYRTGGIEASVALHATVNVAGALVGMPFFDLVELPARSDRGALYFIPLMFVQLILTLAIDLLARRRGLVRMSSPAASIPEIVKAGKMVTNIASSIEPATKDDFNN